MACTDDACRNCGASVEGRFCGACGQRVLERTTLGSLLRGSAGQLLDVEGPLLGTFRAACVSPGGTARRWVDGERVRFVHPLKYALLASTLLAGTVALLRPPLSPFPAASGVDTERLYFLNGVLLPYLSLFTALIVAGLQRLLFLRERFNVAECWMSGLYVGGQVSLLAALLFPLGLNATVPGLAFTTSLGFLFTIWGIMGFYRRRLLEVVGRGLLLGIFSFVALNALGSMIGAVLVAAGFWSAP
jgi:hypothetical protein